MSLLKNVGIGVAGLVGVTLVGYFGYKGFKKIRGKKEDKKECCIPTKEELSRLIQEDEKIIKDLETLHYDESVIKPFRDSLKSKKNS